MWPLHSNHWSQHLLIQVSTSFSKKHNNKSIKNKENDDNISLEGFIQSVKENLDNKIEEGNQTNEEIKRITAIENDMDTNITPKKRIRKQCQEEHMSSFEHVLHTQTNENN